MIVHYYTVALSEKEKLILGHENIKNFVTSTLTLLFDFVWYFYCCFFKRKLQGIAFSIPEEHLSFST